jgi:hypothetical protein
MNHMTEEELEFHRRNFMLNGILAGCLAVCAGFAGCARARARVERYVRIAQGTHQGRDLEIAVNDFRRLASLDRAITQAQGCLRDWGLGSFADRLRNWQRRARQVAVPVFENVERGLAAAEEAAPIPAVQGPAQGQPAHGQPALGQPAHGQPAHGQPAHGQAAGPIPAVHGPAQGQPAHGQPAHGQPAHGQPAHGQPARQSSGSSDSPPVSGELTVSAVTPPRAARRRASASPQPQPSSRAQRSGAGASTSGASPSNRRSSRPR